MPPLQRTLVELPIQTGLQQKTDPRLVDAGAQTTLSNLVQDKLGALSKRPGIMDQGLTASSIWSNVMGQASWSDARILPSQPAGLSQISGGRIWNRSTGGTANDLDSVTHILADEYGIQVAENSLTSFDMCSNGTAILVVWMDLPPGSASANPWMAVFDATNYDIIQIPQQFGSAIGGSVVKCISLSSTQAVIALQVAGNIQAWTFSWTGLGVPTGAGTTINSLVSVATTGAGGTQFQGLWDMSPMQGSTNFVLAYANISSNLPNVVLETHNAALGVVATVAFTASAGNTDRIHGISVIGSTTNNIIWVAYGLNHPSTTTVRAQGWTASFAGGVPSVTDTALWVEEAGLVAEALSIVADPTASAWTRAIIAGGRVTSNGYTRWTTFNTSATVGAKTGARQGLYLASKLYVLGNLVCALLYYNAGNPSFNGVSVLPSYYVAELQTAGTGTNWDARYLATIGPRIANSGLYISAPAQILMPNIVTVSALQVLMVGSTIRNANTQNGIDLLTAYYSNALYQPAIMGDSTYVAAGVPMSFDGQRAINMGFPYQPPSVAAVLASTLGGNLSSYTYTYAAVYEWRTKTGERKQSQPTQTTMTSTSATGIGSITVPSLNLSLEQDWESLYAPAVGIAIYRDTQTTPGQLVRAFAADVPASMLNQFNQSLNYVDSAADATIAGNEQLYTTGNTLGAQCPPSLKSIINHQGRLAGIGGDGLIWLTTKWDEGTTQPYFNDALTLATGDFGRPTALASLDGNLIIFKRDAIYMVGGDGPQNDGTGNTWTQPQRITVDCGCSTDWRSVLVFSGGVTYQNGSKLYLLSRGLEASYFSGAVEDVLAANPVIAGSAVHALRNELRFVCKPSELATTGVVINYNYVTQTWSVFSYYDTDAAVFGADVDACAVLGGKWYHANFKGRLYQEGDGSAGQDNGWDVASHWIVGTRETAWLKSSGIQGYGRFWNAMVLETQTSPHDLTMQVAYNYGSAYTDTGSWTASQIAAFSTAQPQMQLHLTVQKAESMRVKIFDGPPTGVASTGGAGANIIGVTVEAGVKRGRFRIPETQAH